MVIYILYNERKILVMIFPEQQITLPEHDKLRALFEEEKPLVERYATGVSKIIWKLPPTRLSFNLDIREQSDWEKSTDPFVQRISQSLGTLIHAEDRLAINLTEFRESTAEAATCLKGSGLEEVDPLYAGIFTVLSHELVHSRCQIKTVRGETHNLLLDVGEAFLEEAGMHHLISQLDRNEGAISLKGAVIFYRLLDGSELFLGKKIDESLVVVLTSEIVSPFLSNSYSLPYKEAVSAYTAFVDSVSEEEVAAAQFYAKQRPLVASKFFSGDFLNHFIFSLEDEKHKFSALSYLISGLTKEFFEAIS